MYTIHFSIYQYLIVGNSFSLYVTGTFATLFPNNVDKFILDANMSPYNTRDTISKEEAIGLTLRYDYLKFTCWAARIKNPDNCPVDPDELVNCIGKLKQLQTIIQSNDDAKGRVPDYVLSLLNKAGGSLLDFLLLLLSDDPETMGKVCAADDEDATLGLLEGFSSPQKRGVGLEKKSMSCNAYGEGEDDDFCTDYCSTYDRPSATYGPVCFDFDPFGGGRDPSNPVFNLVTAQDVTGGVNAYNNKVFIKQVLAFQDEYGSEYNHPMHEMISHLLASYYWRTCLCHAYISMLFPALFLVYVCMLIFVFVCFTTNLIFFPLYQCSKKCSVTSVRKS